MAISEVNNFQLSWVVARNSATTDACLAFAENAPDLQGTPPADVQITFAGSPLGIQLSGSPAAVRADFETLEDRRFMNATITIAYPVSPSSKTTIGFNFPLLHVTVSVPNVTESQAEYLFAAVRERFPAGRGPQQTELEGRAAKLTRLLLESQTLIASADTVRQRQQEVDEVLQRVTTLAKEATDHLSSIESDVAASEEQRSFVETDREEVTRLLAEIRNLRQEVIAARESVNESKATVDAAEVAIAAFHEDIEKRQAQMQKLETDTSAFVDQYKVETDAVIEVNRNLEVEIREQLLKAAGGTLFGAFDERKRQVVRSKVGWAIAAVLSCLVQAAVVYYLAHEAKDIAAQMTQHTNPWAFYANPLFILKATAAIPILALIVFCIKQYAHERSVEEIYAFKSALSFSLVPYLDLVSRLLHEQATAPHAEFTIRTIGQIFESKFAGADQPAPQNLEGAKDIVEKLRQFVETLAKLKL
jgi:hypothetical protein